MSWSVVAGLLIIGLALWALTYGYEVRFVLLLAACVLAALGQKPEVIIITFLQGMADATSIVPICSAMGFAYVIRAYGCDRELVKALTRPLLHAQYFLIPGTILVGFLVNITIISHTSTSLAVGTVLIPLLRNLGLRAVIIGSALVLGASIGGELLNPGAPELVAIANKLKIETNSLVPEIAKVVFLHLAIAILVYALLWRKDFYQLNTLNTSTGIEDTLVPTKQDAAQSFHEHESNIRWHLAIVPLVPIAILMLFGPPLNVFQFPSHWLLGVAEKSELYAPRLIGLSMLIGCLAACLAVPRQFATVATHFFDGAGYGYIHIISLIVVAKCFSEGIKLSGIAAYIAQLAEVLPVLLLPLAAVMTAFLAFVSGSGIGATQGLYPLLADVALQQQINPIHVGVLCCLGAAAGRTASIVAAVTLMCARLTDTKPWDLSKRVILPLVCALAFSILVVMVRQMMQ